MPSQTHLVVLRGNAASGKTTLAARLQRAMGRGTANVGQDHFRRVVLREHDVPEGLNIALIRDTARWCLDAGYHVICEGILLRAHYGEMLRGLLEGHDGPTHVFYLDVSLAETLRRHENRPLRHDVDPAQLREWYVPGDRLGVPGEIVLDETLDADALLERVLTEVGPVAPRADLPGARFL